MYAVHRPQERRRSVEKKEAGERERNRGNTVRKIEKAPAAGAHAYTERRETEGKGDGVAG